LPDQGAPGFQPTYSSGCESTPAAPTASYAGPKSQWKINFPDDGTFDTMKSHSGLEVSGTWAPFRARTALLTVSGEIMYLIQIWAPISRHGQCPCKRIRKKNVLFCAAKNPGDPTQLYNMLLISK
jgi:hypothetical protein